MLASGTPAESTQHVQAATSRRARQLDGHQGYRPRLARSRRARPRGSALRWSLPYLLAGIANVMYGNVISLPAITGVGAAKDTAGIVLRYATTARASSLDSRA